MPQRQSQPPAVRGRRPQARGKGRWPGVPKTCEISHRQDNRNLFVTSEAAAKAIARKTGKETGSVHCGLKNPLTSRLAVGSIETVDNPRLLKWQLSALQDL